MIKFIEPGGDELIMIKINEDSFKEKIINVLIDEVKERSYYEFLGKGEIMEREDDNKLIEEIKNKSIEFKDKNIFDYIYDLTSLLEKKDKKVSFEILMVNLMDKKIIPLMLSLVEEKNDEVKEDIRLFHQYFLGEYDLMY